MSNREEYLEKLKTKLNDWDADIDAMEAKARQAQSDMTAQYHKQLEAMRVMRADAMKHYSEMQGAASEAWETMAQAAEKSWRTWFDAFEQARSKFKL